MCLGIPLRTNSLLMCSQGFLRSMYDILCSTAANRMKGLADDEARRSGASSSTSTLRLPPLSGRQAAMGDRVVPFPPTSLWRFATRERWTSAASPWTGG